MTIGNLGTGITLSSLASEWGQPATNVKLGDYTADRSTRNEDLYIDVQQISWTDTGPYQAVTGNTTSGAPAATRSFFKFNYLQLEAGPGPFDTISNAAGLYSAPDGRHMYSNISGSTHGSTPPNAYNNLWYGNANGNLRPGNSFFQNDEDTMHEQRDGQGPASDVDFKRFVHPVQNQATGGNLAFTRYNPAGEEVTNYMYSSTDYAMVNFPIMYVTKRTRKIYFGLAPNVNIPFNICTTPNISGSNLATGVTNNGAVYDTNSQYHQFGYTWVILDLQTANFPNTSGVTPTFINGNHPKYYFPEHASDKTTASNCATVFGTFGASNTSPEGRWQSGDKMLYSGNLFFKNSARLGKLDNPGTGVPVGQGNTGQDPSTWNMLWVCSNQELMSQSWFYCSKLGSEVPTYPAGGLPNSSSIPLHADIASVRTPLGINLIPNSNPASVTKNTRPIWKFHFTGTGGTEYSPGNYFPVGPYPTSNDVGIIKNGQTGYAKQTLAAFSPLASNGTVAYSAMFYYPISYTSPGGGNGLGMGQSWSTGPYAQVIVRGDNGSFAGGNFIGGTGNYANTGPDIAAYWANNNSNSFTFYGTPFPGSTNIAVNYSRSGAELTVALTNNTGQDIYWSNTSQTYGGMFGMSWNDGSSMQYGNQSFLYGSGHQARAIDTNAYSKLTMSWVDGPGNVYTQNTYVYHTPTASPSTVATELANMMNNRGGGNSNPSASSAFPPGGNIGDGSGIGYGSGAQRGYASGSNLYIHAFNANLSAKLPNTSSPGPSARTEYFTVASSWDPNNVSGVGGNISATTSAPNGYTKSIMPAIPNTGSPVPSPFGWRQSNTNLPISNVKFGVRLGDFANCVNAGTDGT